VQIPEKRASRDYSAGTAPDDGFYCCLEKSGRQGSESPKSENSRRICPHTRRVLWSLVGFDEISLKKRHKLYVTLMTDLTDPESPKVLAVAVPEAR